MTGYTRIEPTGVTFDYPSVDLDNKLVTARVLLQGKLIMEVVIDVKHDTIQQKKVLKNSIYNNIQWNQQNDRRYVY